MNEVQRALLDTIVLLIGAARWPSGRRITADERRYMAWVIYLGFGGAIDVG